MTKAGRILTAGLLGLALAAPARAQTTVTLEDAGSTAAFGYYVGPYHAVTVTGGVASSPFSIYCVDFAHEVFLGETWTAYVISLGGDLSATREGNDALDQYRKAAWLTEQFAMVAESGWGDIHATIWQIMTPGLAGEPVPSSSYWLDQVNAHYMDQGAAYYDRFTVITPTNELDPTSPQEFLATTTPEPEENVLLGLGLLTLGVALAWRRHVAVG